MLIARFTMDEEKKKVSLHVKGHAGANKYGSDIVCSAASILAYTLAQNAKIEAERGTIKPNPTIKLNDGDAIITCKARDDNGYATILHSYCVIQSGYQLLAHNYPQFCAVEMFGDTEE